MKFHFGEIRGRFVLVVWTVALSCLQIQKIGYLLYHGKWWNPGFVGNVEPW